MKAKEKTDKKTLVLLDAHAILHRAYHALPEFSSPKGEPTGALYGVVAMLLKIIEELKPDYIVSCFDLPEPTHRHEAFEHYKAGRVKTDDGLVAQIIRSRDVFEAFGIPLYELAGFEADDMLGTIVEQTKGDKNLDVIIASGDMDTLQLIDKKRVQVYTLRKGIKDTVLYDEKAVLDRYGFGPKLVADYKGLRGDPSDNIPGIVGVGEKMATELITKFGSIEEIYKKLKKNESAFTEAGIKPRLITLLKENEEEALFSKMLATIRRDAPIDFKIPDGTWRERLDVEKVLVLFAELGFRTLASRVESLFGAGKNGVTEEGEVVDESLLRKTALALWVLESDITNPTLDDILAYARSRGEEGSFKKAADLIYAALNANDLTSVYSDIELPLMEVLADMEQKGIKLDSVYLGELSVTFHKELQKLEKEIFKHAGKEFNINSPEQLGDVIYDDIGLSQKGQKKTATGQRSTRESELEKLRDAHPVIDAILRYRELQKLVSTYIDVLPGLVAQDGHLHTTFLQAGTTTGRVGSKDPNIQNIPVRTEAGRAIRKAFIAEKGYKLVSIDYSQIDLRIAAMLSEDASLVEIFKKGEDVHAGVASRVFGVPIDAVTPDMRRRAKVINFGILYGMGVNALRQNLGEGTTREEAQEFLNAYFNTFTRLAEYLEETKAYARKHGFTKTYFGRRRHFPGINSGAPFIRAQAERMAINAPIQGTAADMLRIAMVHIHTFLKNEKLDDKVRMLLQVHDELVFEIAESKIEQVVPELVRIMTTVLTLKESNGVPMRAEVKVGENWEDMVHYEIVR